MRLIDLCWAICHSFCHKMDLSLHLIRKAGERFNYEEVPFVSTLINSATIVQHH
jgi:hypothetical protein